MAGHIKILTLPVCLSVLVAVAPTIAAGQLLLDGISSRATSSGRLLGDPFAVSDRSFLGGDVAISAAAAYNASADEYLVVWEQRNFGGLSGRTSEILGRRIGVRGEPLGPPFRISHMPDSAEVLGGRNASIAYSSRTNEFLVVFQSDRLERDRFEIFAQRISADGLQIGDEFRVSTSVDQAFFPDIAYNSADNQYLIVWDANQTLFAIDLDIYGQLLDADSASFGEIGSDFRISSMSDPIGNRVALGASVAFNDSVSEYLVVWQSDGGGQEELETEIFAQRLGAGGAEVGTNDFRVTRTTDAGPGRSAFDASVAYGGERYFVAWTGDGGSVVDDQFEIFGVQLSSNGTVEGSEFQVSDADQLAGTAAFSDVSFSDSDQMFFMAWTVLLGFETYQIWGRDSPVNSIDSIEAVPLSSVGGSLEPSVAFNDRDNEFVIVWDDGEIVGQRYSTASNVGVIGPGPASKQSFGIGLNYPNPFRKRTTIPFALDAPGWVRVVVLDILGRQVATLFSGFISGGLHEIAWDVPDAAPGPYIYQVETDRWIDGRIMTHY